MASTFIVLAAFSISNLPAAIGVIWLTPVMVRMDVIAWLLLALGALALFGSREPHPTPGEVLAKTWSLVPFVIFSGLSIFWSVAWGVSLARWLVFLATIVVGGFIGLSCDRRALLRNLGVFLVMILLLSTLLVYLVPTLGVMNYYVIQGAWKGVYWHKNHMGLIAGFACIVFLVLAIVAWKGRSRSRWVWALLYVLAIVLVSQTDSAASYLTLIIMHAMLVVLLGHLRIKEKLRPKHYAILGGIGVLALVIVLANLELVFGLFNRKTNLTGRVPMWGHLFNVFLSQHPWGGYGFNAFWHVESHRTTMQTLAHYRDQIVIADNGFIDILVNTGILGLLLFLLFYVVLWIRVSKDAWGASDVLGLFPLIAMAYILLANLTWSLVFENEGFFMLIMTALMFSMTGGGATGKLEQSGASKRSTKPLRRTAEPPVNA